eukprot:6210010-Pleurochrysis_carterae.AAC.1
MEQGRGGRRRGEKRQGGEESRRQIEVRRRQAEGDTEKGRAGRKETHSRGAGVRERDAAAREVDVCSFSRPALSMSQINPDVRRTQTQ